LHGLKTERYSVNYIEFKRFLKFHIRGGS
jgi:hypothetical protein